VWISPIGFLCLRSRCEGTKESLLRFDVVQGAKLIAKGVLIGSCMGFYNTHPRISPGWAAVMNQTGDPEWAVALISGAVGPRLRFLVLFLFTTRGCRYGSRGARGARVTPDPPPPALSPPPWWP